MEENKKHMGMMKEKKSVQIIVNPYQSQPFRKSMDVKLPPGYGDKSHPKMMELRGKGMSSQRGKH